MAGVRQRSPKVKPRPSWGRVGLVLVVAVVGLFWHPAFLWLATWPPEAERRAATVNGLFATFPISALDAAGAELRVRRDEIGAIRPGPCRRDLSVSAADGLGRHGLIRGRMVILCREDLQHATLGPLQVVIRYDHSAIALRPPGVALNGPELVAALASLRD